MVFLRARLRQQRAPGFTLVELQVALLLVSLMTVLMVGALRLATQSWQKNTERQDVAEHRFLVAQLVRRHLDNMRFVRVRTADGNLAASFFASPEQLHFVAPMPTFINDNSLYWWTLTTELSPDSGVEQLVLFYRPFSAEQIVEFLPDGTLVLAWGDPDNLDTNVLEPLQPTRLVVAEGMEITDAQFYSRDEFGVDQWLDDWMPGNQTPLAIRLVIAEISDDGESPLPEIVVSPRFANQQLYDLVEG